MAMLGMMGMMTLPGLGAGLANIIGGPGSSEASQVLNLLNPMSMLTGGLLGGGSTQTSSSNSSINTVIQIAEMGGLVLVTGLIVYSFTKSKT